MMEHEKEGESVFCRLCDNPHAAAYLASQAEVLLAQESVIKANHALIMAKDKMMRAKEMIPKNNG